MIMGYFDFAARSSPLHYFAWSIAGVCSLLATVLTIKLISEHLRSYRNSIRQRYIIRILWMVPLYAVLSFLSIIMVNVSVMFDVPRDVYESYVIYNFLALCVDYMGGEKAAKTYFSRQKPLKHGFPFCCLGYHTMPIFYDTCRVYVLQYSIVKPVTSIVTLSLYWSKKLTLGDYSIRSPLLWIAIIDNTSVSVALYYLIAFYYASKDNANLQMGRPLPKFLAVKSIIFFAFWQTLTIDMMTAFGVIDSASPEEGDQVQIALADFLICVEMAIIALFHTWIFSVKEHQSGFYSLSCDEDASQGVKVVEMDPHQAARNVLSVQDIFRDVGAAASHLPTLGSTINNQAAAWLVSDRASQANMGGGDGMYSETMRKIASHPEVIRLKGLMRKSKRADERLRLQARLAEVERTIEDQIETSMLNRDSSGDEFSDSGFEPDTNLLKRDRSFDDFI